MRRRGALVVALTGVAACGAPPTESVRVEVAARHVLVAPSLKDDPGGIAAEDGTVTSDGVTLDVVRCEQLCAGLPREGERVVACFRTMPDRDLSDRLRPTAELVDCALR